MEWIDLKKRLSSRHHFNQQWKEEKLEWNIFPEIYSGHDLFSRPAQFKGSGLYFVITHSSDEEYAAFYIKVIRTSDGFQLENQTKKDLFSYIPHVITNLENALVKERLFFIESI
jgi:hypothetical protein